MGITAGFRRKALPRIDGSRSIIKSGATQTLHIHSVRDAVLVGGFLSYRISLRESFRQAAGLAKPLLSLPSFREAASPKKCRLINPPNFNS
jgi:hypothetical protein